MVEEQNEDNTISVSTTHSDIPTDDDVDDDDADKSDKNNIESNDTYVASIPEKSRQKYEKQYEVFVEWCKSKKIKKYTEPVLIKYFEEKSTVAKSSTLWTLFSMLRTTIYINTNVNIGDYKKLISFLKANSHGFKSEKSKSLTRDEVNRFLTNAPDEKYLMMKV